MAVSGEGSRIGESRCEDLTDEDPGTTDRWEPSHDFGFEDMSGSEVEEASSEDSLDGDDDERLLRELAQELESSSDDDRSETGSSSSESGSSASSSSSDSSSSSSSSSPPAVPPGAGVFSDGEQPDDAHDARVRLPAGVRRAPEELLRFQVGNHGELRFSATDGYIRAFCSHHGSDCRRQRTTAAAAHRPAQGRCIGELVAWLMSAEDHESRSAHVKARKSSYEKRVEARRVFNGLPHASVFARNERPRRDGEDEEPSVGP